LKIYMLEDTAIGLGIRHASGTGSHPSPSRTAQ